MKDTKVQWHPGFVAAMSLELAKNRDGLMFEKEYNLNTKPLEIDLLIIKKRPDLSIDNEIGHIFRGHNILEYKSPDDHLNIDTFYKAEAYAALYKSYGKGVDSIKADDITVTLARDTKPAGLFRYFEEHSCPVSNPYGGIYYIGGAALFPTQVIVTGELERGAHTWLRALSGKIGRQDLIELVEDAGRLEGEYDRELADSVLEVSIQANERIAEELKGDGNMGQALLKLMEPQLLVRDQENMEKGIKKGMEKGMEKGIEKGIKKGIKRGMEKGKIYGMISAYRDLDMPDEAIMKKIQEKFRFSKEDAEQYMKNNG